MTKLRGLEILEIYFRTKFRIFVIDLRNRLHTLVSILNMYKYLGNGC